jgi:hypothetical protein
VHRVAFVRIRGCWIVVIAAWLACARTAFAEPGPESPKREVPDYDGRGRDDADGAGVWLARILLSPLYFTSEYLLRRPLGALTIAAERGDVPRKVYDFFAFGPDHKIGFVPVGLVDFGFNPSVGIYAFWNDAFVRGNDLHLHYEVWPTDWYSGTIADRLRMGERRELGVRLSALRRPDNVFYGLGPSSLQSNQSRYTSSIFEAQVALSVHPWRSSQVTATTGLRKVDLSPGYYQDDPSLEQSAARGAFALPAGFNRGYLDPYSRLSATLDTRAATEHGSGLKLEAQGEIGGDVEHAPATGWIRWGGTASAIVDLNDHGRVLSLSVATLFADPLTKADIPFTELVSLGGDTWMHGYFPGRLVDRSAFVSTLQYKWPIAAWLDGTMHVALGNVFGAHLEGFAADLLRLSAGLGIATTSEPPLELIVGIGTETFEHGAQVDSVRVSLGIPRSF